MSMENRRQIPKIGPISDPLIIPRVKQYLEENVHQTYVDVGVMARHLQEKYREYGRRKSQPFRYLVDQAYKTVLHSYGLDSNPSTEEEENSDLELMEDQPAQSNHMNNILTDMYRSQNDPKPPTTQNEFPIDISSDEDDEDTATKNTNNGHSSKLPKEILLGSVAKESKSALSVTTPTTTISPIAIAKKRKLDANSFDGGSDRNAPWVPLASRQISKRFKKEFTVRKSDKTFDNIGGIDKILKQLCEFLLHVNNPNVHKFIGIPAPHGLLLFGPPGSGKTLLAQAIAGQMKVGLIQITSTELVSGVSGESEERIRDLFEQAAMCAPCVLFIDEIHCVTGNRETASKEMERRILAQLITSLDDLSKLPGGDQVLVIGATNRADSLDPAIRRVGRFDHEICLGIPDRDARREILQIICKTLRLGSYFDYELIASLTPGFVGADLLALASQACTLAVKKMLHVKQERALKESTKKVKKLSPIAPASEMGPGVLMQAELSKMDEEDFINSPSITEQIAKDENQENQKTKDVPETITESSENQAESSSPKTDETDIIAGTNTDEIVKTADDSKPIENSPSVKASSSTDTSTNESLAEALLKNDSIKDRMGLDMMFKWIGQKGLVTEDDLSDMYVTLDDFVQAVKMVQPSAKREGFITVPDVTWDDIGSLQDIREELNLAILAPAKFPNRLKALGIKAPSGVLLCGPPGCGKTLLAKAIANEAGINFISVKGPELLNMYVGESERAVRQCFQRGRNSAPCVIFFDEFDALCPKRSGSDSQAGSRVVNQLLTEMDGVEERKGVYIMAASNRPDMIDPAVLRPGRLDRILYVGLPGLQDRLEILKAATKQGKEPVLADDVDLEELAKLTDSFTGADLAGLVQQASLQALHESLTVEVASEADVDLSVHKRHFLVALKNARPSVSAEDKIQYEMLRTKFVSPSKLK